MRNKYFTRIALTLLMLIIIFCFFGCDWQFSDWFDRDTEAIIRISNENNEEGSFVSKTVFIDGGDSICGTSESLTYKWTFEAPGGSTTLLEEVFESGKSNDSKRKFTPDVPGCYKIALDVVDDDSDSDSIIMDVIVKDKPQSTPANLNLKNAEVTNLNIGWEAVVDSTQYLLFRATSISGPFTNIVYEGRALECIDNGLISGTTYYYKVQAKNPAGVSEMSDYIEATTKLGVPTNFQATGNTTTSANLSWDPSHNALSYIVEKKLAEDGSFVEAFSGNATTCNLASLDTGAIYYFRIKALNSISNSDYSTPIRVNLSVSPPSIPENSMITVGTQNSLTYSWSSVGEATSYNVYRSSAEDGIYSKVGNAIVDIPYTDTSLIPGTRYYYKVTSVVSVFDGSTPIYLESGKSNSSTGITVPSNPSYLSIVTRTGTSITISCPSVPGADDYGIFKREGSSGAYVEVGPGNIQISGTDFTVTGLSPNTQHTFKMTANNVTGASGYSSEISASTLSLPSYTISASAGTGGSISPSGNVTVSQNGSKSFSISANSGYLIQSVYVDGVNQGAISNYNFSNVTSNHTITASFILDLPSTYTITATAGSGGSISPNGNVSVLRGGNKTFIISPNSGYSISDIKVDGTSQGAESSYTFSNVNTNHSISATFVPIYFTITASSGLGGGISPSGNVNIIHGSNKTFSVYANSGYRISNVKVDDVSQGSISSYTFYGVTEDHSIDAEFSIISTDIQALSVSMTIESSWPRNTHPKTLVFSLKNAGPTALYSDSYRTDIYLSTNSNISSSDIKIGEYIVPPFSLGVGKTITEFAEISLLSGITIPSNIAWGEYYVGLHVVPIDDSPSDTNDNNNWIVGNTVVIPLEFTLKNDSSHYMDVLQFRKAGTSTWGKDLISGYVSPGSNFSICLELDDAADYYDVRAMSTDDYTWLSEDIKLEGLARYTWRLIN